MKTLLVGWDAACWDYVRPLLEAGRLPALSSLIASGTAGTLRSTMPPWTPTAWATLITGRDPGGHGVFDLLSRSMPDGALRPINAASRVGQPFWKHLNRSGIRTGLVNVPFIYPLDSLDGFAVCGFGTPNSAAGVAFPERAAAMLAADFPDFRPEVDAQLLRNGSADEIFEAEARQQSQFVEIAVRLTGQIPVDLLVINLMFPDHANHKMPEMEQVWRAYERTDNDLARLIDSFQPDSVMLISDHGSTRAKGDFWLSGWLRDRGFLVELTPTRAEQSASINRLLGETRPLGRAGWVRKILRRIRNELLLRSSGRLKRLFWARIERDFPGLHAHIRWSGKPDPERSPVMPGSAFAGLLYLNPKSSAGRDPAGTAQRLRTALEQITDPDTGAALFSGIYLKEEIYTGRAAGAGPDLVLDAYDSNWIIRTTRYSSNPGPAKGDYFFSRANHGDYGWHGRDGIYIFNGKPFNRNAPAVHARLADIPATLLHSLDLAVPGEYDGQVLLETLSEQLRTRPVRTLPPVENSDQPEQAEFTDPDADKLVQQLRALGYLD